MHDRSRALFVTALFLTTLGVFVRLVQIPEFQYSLWTDRDLFRAMNFEGMWRYLGPELTQAGRTPGGLLYFLLHLFTRVFGDSPQTLNFFNVLFQIFGLGVLYHSFRQFLLKETSLLLIAQLCCGYIFLDYSQVLWHPGLAFLPLCLTFLCFIIIVTRGVSWPVIPLFFLVGVLAQFHLSYIMLFPVFLMTFLTLKQSLKKSHLLIGLVSLVALYTPYFLYDLERGFQNTKGIFLKGVSLSHHNYLSYFFTRVDNFVQVFSSFLGMVVGADGNPTGIGFNERAAIASGGWGVTLNIMLKGLTIPFTFLFLLGFYYNRSLKNAIRRHLYWGFTFGLILATILFFLSPKSFSLGFRRYFFLVPFLYSIAGLYFDELDENNFFKRHAPLLLGVSLLTNMGYFYLSLSKVHPSFQLKKEVVQISTEQFLIPPDKFYQKVGYLGSDFGSFSTDENESGYHSLIKPNIPFEKENKNCLLVLLGYDKSLHSAWPVREELLTSLKKNPLMKRIQFFSSEIIYGQYGIFLPYQNINGNCLNTKLANPYIPYGNKSRLEHLKNRLKVIPLKYKIGEEEGLAGVFPERTDPLFYAFRTHWNKDQLFGTIDTTPLQWERYIGPEITQEFSLMTSRIVVRNQKGDLIQSQLLIPQAFHPMPFLPPYHFKVQVEKREGLTLEFENLKGERILGPFALTLPPKV